MIFFTLFKNEWKKKKKKCFVRREVTPSILQFHLQLGLCFFGTEQQRNLPRKPWSFGEVN